MSGSLRVVVVSCVAQFMVVLDVSVVNVALPSLGRDLGFEQSGLQWVVNGYGLAFAGFLLVGGRLADLYGTKRVFLTGLALFTGASLVGGAATSPDMLVVARVFQGLGAAVLSPATLTVLTTTFAEGTGRNRALAMWTVVAVAGGSAGNIAGGVLTELLSWRWILFINVPVGAAISALALLYLGKDRSPIGGAGLDIPGALLATVGIATLTYAVSRTDNGLQPDGATVVCLAICALAAVSFVAVERRVARSPLVPLRLFGSRSLSVGNVVMLLAGACLMPMWYFLTLYMQNVLGYGPLITGVAFLPHTLVAIAVGFFVTPVLMRKVDGWILVSSGSAVASVGFLLQSSITADSGYIGGILVPGVIVSAGGGLLNAPITSVVTSGVPEKDAGAASGIMNTSKQVGGAVGLALLVAISTVVTQEPGALAAGYGRSFAAMSLILAVAAAVGFFLRDGTRKPVRLEGRD